MFVIVRAEIEFPARNHHAQTVTFCRSQTLLPPPSIYLQLSQASLPHPSNGDTNKHTKGEADSSSHRMS